MYIFIQDVPKKFSNNLEGNVLTQDFWTTFCHPGYLWPIWPIWAPFIPLLTKALVSQYCPRNSVSDYSGDTPYIGILCVCIINNPHVEEEEEVTEQVDGIDRDPAEKESNAYAPQSFVITYEWYEIYNIWYNIYIMYYIYLHHICYNQVLLRQYICTATYAPQQFFRTRHTIRLLQDEERIKNSSPN